MGVKLGEISWWRCLSSEQRVRVYEALGSYELCNLLTKLHGAKNNYIRTINADVVVDRGFLTVVCDCSARLMMNGESMSYGMA